MSAIDKKQEIVESKTQWKSLDELSNNQEYRQFVEEEFPKGAVQAENPTSRRDFLKYMGASLVMAGLAGCDRQPEELIVPYVKSVEEIVPGKPLFYATSMHLNGHATGLLVESHMGRPTRVEGNPLHPDSEGAASIFHQAAILDLYDPDRSKEVLRKGKTASWKKFDQELRPMLRTLAATGGKGVRILTETIHSPSLGHQMRKILKKFPKAKWHVFDPLSGAPEQQVRRVVFGKETDMIYDFSRASVVVSLDADFLSDTPGNLRYARQLADKRRDPQKPGLLNRIYAAEPSPTITGGYADQRLNIPSKRMPLLVAHLARKLGVAVVGAQEEPLRKEERAWLEAVEKDITSQKGSSLVLAGRHQPKWVHALTHAINDKLQNFGKTISHIPKNEVEEGIRKMSLATLSREMRQGEIQLLLILGGNPGYTAPSDLDFEKYLSHVPTSIHLSTHMDETSAQCTWHLPQAHFLEAFSDGKASNGTISFSQPLIKPLYDGKSSHEVLAMFLGKKEPSSHEIVRDYWKSKWGAAGFEKKWRRVLHDGVVDRSAPMPLSLPMGKPFSKRTFGKMKQTPASGIEILFRPDPTVWDGRFANNGWLQECPKPMTKLTWENAALIGPGYAAREHLANGDVIEIQFKTKKLEAPVWIVPGQSDETIVLPLGYGRKRAGKLGSRRGFNAYTLRTTRALDSFFAGAVRKTGKKRKLASTQNHHSMEGRELVRSADLKYFQDHPHFAKGHHHGPFPSLYPEYPPGEYAWGMVINLNACIGCNACVIACQSENNIPVVGKEEVAMGREMHWLRVDRYFEGKPESPEIHYQPVPCMHCENAPCEPVCPVGATNHSEDGLNQMIYNRCVGTRYCSNNCPYKVRRFNFFEYTDKNVESLKLMRNPDVTVRSRGVMEKCTFCVQRINHARIDAKKENRRIAEGDVVTACQSACPTQAIAFGDLSNAKSQAAQLKKHVLNYGILEELAVKPRVTYHAKVKNIHG